MLTIENIDTTNDVFWITSAKGTIGIIRGKDPITGLICYYVSAVDGKDLLTDIEYVLAWGSKLDPMMLFNFIKDDVKSNVDKHIKDEEKAHRELDKGVIIEKAYIRKHS